MLGWIFGKRTKCEQFRQSDRTERNAVIRRIVTAAAETTQKRVDRSANGDVIGPFVVNPSSADDPSAKPVGSCQRYREHAATLAVRGPREETPAESAGVPLRLHAGCTADARHVVESRDPVCSAGRRA